ncbi:MAG: methyltransferase domain-containing protein [Kiritimatiellae bacterium]|nr:methyltransferase domain-containing protein [Kiritimatiellia bacterium]
MTEAPASRQDPSAVIERLTADYRAALPLRLETEACARILDTINLNAATCLDVGFANPLSSRALRQMGGYWATAVGSAEHRRLASEILGEAVLQVGANGELPYEDKQFDVVVVGRGHLCGARDADEALVRECHRVLKTPGYLILNCDFRKTAGVASLLARRTPGGHRAGYSESQLFDLLKTGFDVLGVKTYCRFWVQLARQLLARPGRNPRLVNIVYWIAAQLDFLLVFTKGYQMLAHGRRKGWRPRQTPVLTGGRSIGEAVLRRSGI